MYHLEMLAFPKRVQRFNLGGQELGAILLPWVQERVIEFGEQKWSPHEATLTVLEGEEIPVHEVSMGRGWRAAERACVDVTEKVLAEARAHAGGGAAAAAEHGGGDDALELALQLGALLGPDASRLLEGWRAVRGREPQLSPSEALAAAERALAGG